VLGLLALIGLLAMVQSGQLTLRGSLPASAASPRSSKTGASSKPQKLYPRQATTVANLAAAGAEQPEPVLQRQPRRELYQALARMDADAAADMLGELDADSVTELLLAQRERDLARILEAAPPFEAAEWIADFLEAAPTIDETPNGARQAAAPGAAEAGQPPAAADSGTDPADNDAIQESADDSSNQVPPAPQEGAEADESALSNGNAADGDPLQLPPDTNTA
jgi:hypothetical protein